MTLHSDAAFIERKVLSVALNAPVGAVFLVFSAVVARMDAVPLHLPRELA